ncbi:MAG: endonuclease/exonuclease/phosphatase family protein [Pseudomonadota bacterium]
MRIAYWNIRAGGGKRAQWIVDQLLAWRPHVVGLCEFRGTEASTELAGNLAEAGFAWQRDTVLRRAPATNACFIAAREPFQRVGLKTSPPDPVRWLMVRLASGLVVGILHAPNYVTGRKRPYFDAVTAFARRWRGGPAIFGGDTNCGVPPVDGNPDAFSEWESRWIPGLEKAGWADVYRQFEPDAPCYTWYSPNAGNGYRLDQAFINRPALPRLRGARYEWGAHPDAPDTRHALSDHAALLVDFN